MKPQFDEVSGELLLFQVVDIILGDELI